MIVPGALMVMLSLPEVCGHRQAANTRDGLWWATWIPVAIEQYCERCKHARSQLANPAAVSGKDSNSAPPI